MDEPAVAERSPDFETDGFVVLDEPLSPEAVGDALAAVERLEGDAGARRERGAGVHVNQAGLERMVMRRPPAPVRSLASAEEVTTAAASLLGDPTVVAWGHEVLTKRPAGSGDGGAIGWHQDRPYFHWWEGPTLTAWVALTEQTPDSAPVVYIPGSHTWGDRFDTTAFDRSPAETRPGAEPVGETWSEVAVTGPAGTVALHHPGTVHGSGVNRTTTPRRSLAVRLRAEHTVLRTDTPARLRRALVGGDGA